MTEAEQRAWAAKRARLGGLALTVVSLAFAVLCWWQVWREPTWPHIFAAVLVSCAPVVFGVLTRRAWRR